MRRLELGVGVRGRGELDALDHLHPRLRLAGLARLGLEAIDEGLQMRDLTLLLAAQCALLGHALGAQALELRVVAGIERGRALREMQRVGRDGIEEIAVVRDHQHRARIADQPGLQPQHGIEIEVVGRFVEQQDVGAAEQRAGKVQPHAPAAGELGHRARLVRRLESQAVQQLRRPRAAPHSRRWRRASRAARRGARRRGSLRPPRAPLRFRAARCRRRARSRARCAGSAAFPARRSPVAAGGAGRRCRHPAALRR